MIERPFWKRRLEMAWSEAHIAWLCGVRRSGKTTLVKSFDPEEILYVNCDMPAVEEMIRDPHLFFRDCSKPLVAFDEKQPKVYAFDTGFVSFARGWEPLRPEDLGILWEHMILEYLQAHFPDAPARYWRDKQGHEVDFILTRRREEVDAIECKWSPDAFESKALTVFRGYYPKGRNYLITPSGVPAYTKRFGKLEVRVCTPDELSANGADL